MALLRTTTNTVKLTTEEKPSKEDMEKLLIQKKLDWVEEKGKDIYEED